MAGKVKQTLGCLWRAFVRFARVVIFLASALLIILLVKDIVMMFSLNELHNYVPGTQLKGFAFIQLFILILTGITGCYAACNGRPPAMQSFQALLVISIFILITLVITLTKNQQSDFKETTKAMKENLVKYNWLDRNASDSATKAWNVFQSIGCCGLEGPGDWNQSRPSSISNSLFPGSCCRNVEQITPEGFCDISHTIEYGCLNSLNLLESFALVMQIIYIIYLFSILLITLTTCSCCTSASKETNRSRVVNSV